MAILVSFIIPHKGREELLIQTIESILNQNIDPNLVEIHIVTQNMILDEVKEGKNIKIHFQPEDLTISALRNYGASKAQGTYLAFLDADIALDKNWTNTAVKELQNKSSRVIISTIQKNSDTPSTIEKIRTTLNNINRDSTVESLPGSNLLIKREVFLNSCKFPEELATCEDIFFTNQMHKKGDLYVTSETSHIHLGEDKSYRQLFQKEIWRGQSNILSMKGREIPLRELPSIIIPIAILVLFILLIVTLTAGSTFLAILLFISLFTPFLAYSLRLYIRQDNQSSIVHLLAFYLVYFPARTIGTIGGLFKSFKNTGIK